jgi:hypothetical protein
VPETNWKATVPVLPELLPLELLELELLELLVLLVPVEPLELDELEEGPVESVVPVEPIEPVEPAVLPLVPDEDVLVFVPQMQLPLCASHVRPSAGHSEASWVHGVKTLHCCVERSQ